MAHLELLVSLIGFSLNGLLLSLNFWDFCLLFSLCFLGLLIGYILFFYYCQFLVFQHICAFLVVVNLLYAMFDIYAKVSDFQSFHNYLF